MLGDAEWMRADRLTVPASDPRQAVGDVVEFDVEGEGSSRSSRRPDSIVATLGPWIASSCSQAKVSISQGLQPGEHNRPMGRTFFARVAAAGLAMLSLTGCQPYLLHVALGQGDLLTRAVPIERAIADPGTSAEAAEKLALVRDAAAFAVYWGLDVGRSYRTYAVLDREATVWTVFR